MSLTEVYKLAFGHTAINCLKDRGYLFIIVLDYHKRQYNEAYFILA